MDNFAANLRDINPNELLVEILERVKRIELQVMPSNSDRAVIEAQRNMGRGLNGQF